MGGVATVTIALSVKLCIHETCVLTSFCGHFRLTFIYTYITSTSIMAGLHTITYQLICLSFAGSLLLSLLILLLLLLWFPDLH